MSKKASTAVSEAIDDSRKTREQLIDELACLRARVSELEKSKGESVSFHQIIMENSADAIFIADQKGCYVHVNKAACNLLGYTRDELLEMSVSDLVPGGKTEESKNNFRQVVSKGGVFKELVLVRKDGSSLPADLNAVVLPNGLVYGSCRDITAAKEAEAQIKSALAEKGVLLREIHHRVKNNLTVISSLLRLQANYLESREIKQIFDEICNRIQAMALAHEMLYKSRDLTGIGVDLYIQELVSFLSSLYNGYRPDVAIELQVEDHAVDIDMAIPCGLIINELISNAFKYAFPHNEEGKITVFFKKIGDNAYQMGVGDNGIGLPGDINVENTHTLGLKLVSLLAQQMEAPLKVFRDEGTRFQLSIPIPGKK